MKEIQLTQGKTALVDDEDYEYLSQWKWTANFSKGKFYARRHLGNRKYLSMHKDLILSDLDVDHIDGDSLNNQKYNLRTCTHLQNMQNGKIKSNNTSGYKGVNWYKKYEMWVARITVNKNRICLGYFNDVKDAARAYDAAARQYFGDFARTNF